MKAIVILALLTALLPFSTRSFAQSEERSPEVLAESAQLEEASLALAYRAYLAVEKLDALYQSTGKTVLQRQAYLLRAMRVEALTLAEDLKMGAPQETLDAHQQVLADQLLQSEGYRREIQSIFRGERELTQKLADVRRTAYYLQQLLTGQL